MIKKGIFDIVDTNGGTKLFDYNQEKKFLVYEAGCYLILWDLELDKKMMMHPHESEISFIMFFGANQEFLLSLDRGLKPAIFISQWHTLTRLHQIYLPQNRKNQPVVNFTCAYSVTFNSLIIAENYSDRYIFSIWDFKRESLNLLLSNDEEALTHCRRIHIFEHNYSLFFSTVEQRCIKYWKLENKRLTLANRIHVREDIIDTQMSPLTNFLLFLGDSGRLYIINSEGQYISSMIHSQLQFSALSLDEDYLFIGTLQGEIEIYQMSSMKCIKSLTYFRDTVQNHRRVLRTQELQSPNGNVGSKNLTTMLNDRYKDLSEKLSENIAKIIVGRNHNLIITLYKDKSLFCYDYQKNKIIYAQAGHSKKIQEIIWSPSSKKTFVSCSDDGQIRIWNFIGDIWQSTQLQPLDEKYRVKNGDQNKDFSFQENGKNLHQIPAMDVDWVLGEIYIGDVKGNIMIFDLETGKLKFTHSIARCKICHIATSINYIGVTLATGETLLYDKNSNFRSSIKLEEASANAGSQTKFHKRVCLLETDKERLMKKASEVSKNSSVMIQSRIRVSTQGSLDNTQANITKDLNFLKSSTIKVISVHNINTLRLHQISKNQSNLTGICLVKYILEGRIMEFRVHPSNEYLIVLTNDGKLSILKLANGELKGSLEIRRPSTQMTIDPSGLYAFVASPCPILKDSSKSSSPLKSGGRDTLTSFLKGENTRSCAIDDNSPLGTQFNRDQSIISVYEIGTGDFVGDIGKIPTVSTLSIAYDSSYLAVGTKRGTITILAIDPNIRENIYEVLDGMRMNPYFWDEYPFLLDENKQSKIIPTDVDQKDPSIKKHFQAQDISKEFSPTAIKRNESHKQARFQSEQKFMEVRATQPEDYLLPQDYAPNQYKNSNPKQTEVGVQSDDILTGMTTYIPFDGVKTEDLIPFRRDWRGNEVNPTSFKSQIRATQSVTSDHSANPLQFPKIASTKNSYEKYKSHKTILLCPAQSLVEEAKDSHNFMGYQVRNEEKNLNQSRSTNIQPKIYKDAGQQVPLSRDLGDQQFRNSYKADPFQRMYKSNLLVRSIRPDPDDIDNDDAGDYDPRLKDRIRKGIYDDLAELEYEQQYERDIFRHQHQTHSIIQADPEGIDDSLENFPEAEDGHQYASRQNEYYRVPQEAFSNNRSKGIPLSQSDLNDEGSTSVLDQLSEFERRLKRDTSLPDRS